MTLTTAPVAMFANVSSFTLVAYILIITGILLSIRTARNSLSKIPGPRLWSWSIVPYVYHLYTGTVLQKLAELHDKYGEALRIGPSHVIFITPTAWKDIYARQPDGSVLLRDPTWLKSSPGRTNDITTSNREDHPRMRKVLGRGFDAAAIPYQESFTKRHTARWIERLRGFAKSDNNTIDAAEWIPFLVYDLVGEFIFGSEIFHCVEDGAWPPAMLQLFDLSRTQAYRACVRHLPIPYLEEIVERLTPSNWVKTAKEQPLIDLMSSSLTYRATEQIEGRPNRYRDLMGTLLHGTETGELSTEEMGKNAGLLLGGGGETVANTMCILVNFLARNPDKLAKVTKEVRDRFTAADEINEEAIKQLEYVEAVIREGLRIGCPIPFFPPKLTDRDTEVADHLLPPNTHTGILMFAAFRSERLWHRATEFLPERWLKNVYEDPKSPFHNDVRSSLHPFGFGVGRCLGMTLAWLEIRMILTNMLLAFDFEASKTPDGKEFMKWEDQKCWGLWERESFYITIKEAATE